MRLSLHASNSGQAQVHPGRQLRSMTEVVYEDSKRSFTTVKVRPRYLASMLRRLYVQIPPYQILKQEEIVLVQWQIT